MLKATDFDLLAKGIAYNGDSIRLLQTDAGWILQAQRDITWKTFKRTKNIDVAWRVFHTHVERVTVDNTQPIFKSA